MLLSVVFFKGGASEATGRFAMIVFATPMVLVMRMRKVVVVDGWMDLQYTSQRSIYWCCFSNLKKLQNLAGLEERRERAKKNKTR